LPPNMSGAISSPDLPSLRFCILVLVGSKQARPSTSSGLGLPAL
jgi:hypothetical protein